MKKYDRVFIPVVSGEELQYVYQCNYLLSYSKQIMATKINPLMLKEVEGPAIVLTPEELRRLLDDIVHQSEKDQWGGHSVAHAYVSHYLKSKQIDI